MTELLLCGPQARLPSARELSRQRQVLLRHRSFCQSLTATLKDLPRLLAQLAVFDTTLKRAPVTASASLDFLLQWLDIGHISLPVDTLPNVAALPFTVLLQTALFLQHLTRDSSAEEPSYRQTIKSLSKYGVQGFCTGFLTAAVINFSRNEEQLAEYAAISLRLAMCIGAYIDHNALNAEDSSRVCSLSVRWREGQFSKSQVEDLLSGYERVS
jgi:Starter unit:ACP transacylase in aflatoxin biosynthesis